MIRELVKIGVVDPFWLRDIEMFGDFQNIEIKSTMCKYTILAEKYHLSEESIRKRIKVMKDE